MSKRAAIYCRVSTEDQQDHGCGLDLQLTDCRQFAVNNDLEIVAEIQDNISGRVEIQQRPGGKNLYHLINSKMIDAIITYNQKRLSRDDDALEVQVLAAHLQKKGIDLYLVNRGLVKPDIAGKILMVFDGLQAADEWEETRRKTMSGRLECLNKGDWIPPKTPYGYSRFGHGHLDAHFEIDENQADIVRWIFAEYTGQGGREPKSLQSITFALIEKGIPPKKRNVVF